MKLIAAARSAGVAFALVLIGAFAYANVSPVWSPTPGPGVTNGTTPGTTGPWLGDYTFNIYNIWLAHHRLQGVGFSPSLSVSQTSGQANCTQLNTDGLQQISTSASTGYVCLPTAVAGKIVMIAMVPAQTLDIYSSATSFTSGTADTINGTAGT